MAAIETSSVNPPQRRQPPPRPAGPIPRLAKGRRPIGVRYVAGGVLLGTALATTVLLVFFSTVGGPKDLPPDTNDATAQTDRESSSTNGLDLPHEVADPVMAVDVPTVLVDDDPLAQAESAAKPQAEDASETRAAPAASPAVEPAVADALQELRAKGRQLPLPSPESETGAPPVAELVRLGVASPSECQLTLIDLERTASKSGLSPLKLGPFEDLADENLRRWPVLRKIKSEVGEEQHTLGNFELRGQALSFAWTSDLSESAAPQGLRLCLLEVTVGELRERCSLCSTIRYEPWKLDAAKNRLIVDLPSDLSALSHLQFAVWLEGISSPKEPVPLNQESAVDLTVECASGSATVPITLSFSLKREGAAQQAYRLACDSFLELPQVRQEKSQPLSARRTDGRAPATSEVLSREKKASENLLRKLNAERSQREKKVEKQEKSEAAAAGKKSRTNRATPKTSAPKKPTTRKAKEADDSESLTQEIGELESAIETLNAALERIDQLQDGLDYLQTRCRVGLDVFVVNHGVRIEVLSTKPAP